jgi:hypothetical protein
LKEEKAWPNRRQKRELSISSKRDFLKRRPAKSRESQPPRRRISTVLGFVRRGPK